MTVRQAPLVPLPSPLRNPLSPSCSANERSDDRMLQLVPALAGGGMGRGERRGGVGERGGASTTTTPSPTIADRRRVTPNQHNVNTVPRGRGHMNRSPAHVRALNLKMHFKRAPPPTRYNAAPPSTSLFYRRFQSSVPYERTRERILTKLGDKLGCPAALLFM